MSRNTLYRYYQDKTDLGFAILGRNLSRSLRQINRALEEAVQRVDVPAIDRLEVILRDYFLSEANSLDGRFIAEFDAYFSGARIPKDFLNRLEHLLSFQPNKQLSDLIHQGQRDGSIRQDIDVAILDPLIINAIRATKQRFLLRGEVLIETRSSHFHELMPSLLTILMDGIRPRAKH